MDNLITIYEDDYYERATWFDIDPTDASALPDLYALLLKHVRTLDGQPLNLLECNPQLVQDLTSTYTLELTATLNDSGDIVRVALVASKTLDEVFTEINSTVGDRYKPYNPLDDYD